MREIGDWKDEILRHEEQLSANEKKYKKICRYSWIGYECYNPSSE